MSARVKISLGTLIYDHMVKIFHLKNSPKKIQATLSKTDTVGTELDCPS